MNHCRPLEDGEFKVPEAASLPAYVRVLAARGISTTNVVTEFTVSAPGTYRLPTVARLAGEHGPFIVSFSEADGITHVSPPFGLPDYRCPRCFALSDIVLCPAVAMCANWPRKCDVLLFNPETLDGVVN